MMKEKFKKLIPVVIFVLIFGFIGCLAYVNKPIKNETENQAAEETINTNDEEEATGDEENLNKTKNNNDEIKGIKPGDEGVVEFVYIVSETSLCEAEISRDTITAEEASLNISEENPTTLDNTPIISTPSYSPGYEDIPEPTVEPVPDPSEVQVTHVHKPDDPVEEQIENERYMVTRCTVCNEILEKSIVLACNHLNTTTKRENENPATCTAAGSYDLVVCCTVCGEELSREAKTIPKIAHTPAEAVEENRFAPTCKKTGSYEEVIYCAVCKEELSRKRVIEPPAGHTQGDPVEEQIENERYMVTYCTVCGKMLNREKITNTSENGGEPAPEIEEHDNGNGNGETVESEEPSQVNDEPSAEPATEPVDNPAEGEEPATEPVDNPAEDAEPATNPTQNADSALEQTPSGVEDPAEGETILL